MKKPFSKNDYGIWDTSDVLGECEQPWTLADPNLQDHSAAGRKPIAMVFL